VPRARHRFASWILPLLGLLLAGCGGAAERAAQSAPAAAGSEPLPEWRRGVFPPPDAQPAASPPSPGPADEAAIASFFAEVAEVCPASEDSESSPGLSPPARRLPRPEGRIHRPLSWFEVQSLERLLQATASAHPDRPRILDRLATDYFLLEQALYRECLKLSLESPRSRKALLENQTQLRQIREQLPKMRALGFERCASLATEHPSYARHTPCSAESAKERDYFTPSMR
jgi:hypothetical protein